MKKIYTMVLLLVLAACAGPKTGEVTDREYHRSYTSFSTVCSRTDEKGICRGYVTVPHFHAEACYLNLKHGEEEGWREIPCSEYAGYTIGDYYPKGM